MRCGAATAATTVLIDRTVSYLFLPRFIPASVSHHLQPCSHANRCLDRREVCVCGWRGGREGSVCGGGARRHHCSNQSYSSATQLKSASVQLLLQLPSLLFNLFIVHTHTLISFVLFLLTKYCFLPFFLLS